MCIYVHNRLRYCVVRKWRLNIKMWDANHDDSHCVISNSISLRRIASDCVALKYDKTTTLGAKAKKTALFYRVLTDCARFPVPIAANGYDWLGKKVSGRANWPSINDCKRLPVAMSKQPAFLLASARRIRSAVCRSSIGRSSQPMMTTIKMISSSPM